MKKLIIQIPCYNEEASLPVTLKALPKSVPGYDKLEVLVIDDGSTDNTVAVAKKHKVKHIVSHDYNRGLAQAFSTGIETALKLGAHTIINTDADNQYRADDIKKLVKPILDGEALVVIGERPIESIKQFSWTKKLFQALGSWVVRVVSGTSVADAPCGFRAVHRDVARRLSILSDYTYTIEMIIQLGIKKIPIVSVPIRVNDEMRPSRLIRSNLDYVIRNALTILRLFVLYRPITFFSYISGILFSGTLLLGIRYLYYMYMGHGTGHVQSLLLASILAVSAVMCFLIGLVCDSNRINRLLLEELRYRQLSDEKNN